MIGRGILAGGRYRRAMIAGMLKALPELGEGGEGEPSRAENVHAVFSHEQPGFGRPGGHGG